MILGYIAWCIEGGIEKEKKPISLIMSLVCDGVDRFKSIRPEPEVSNEVKEFTDAVLAYRQAIIDDYCSDENRDGYNEFTTQKNRIAKLYRASPADSRQVFVEVMFNELGEISSSEVSGIPADGNVDHVSKILQLKCHEMHIELDKTERTLETERENSPEGVVNRVREKFGLSLA